MLIEVATKAKWQIYHFRFEKHTKSRNSKACVSSTSLDVQANWLSCYGNGLIWFTVFKAILMNETSQFNAELTA